MELALRTLTDYYLEIKDSFYLDELVALIFSERDHLILCLNGLADLGYEWGFWPVHLALWNAVDADDSLLERVFIVHRYLEGSGLDAGDTILRRLSGTGNPRLSQIVKTISDDEMDHVQLGSRWFFDICKMQKKDPSQAFKSTLDRIKHQLPKRLEPINISLRQQALFTLDEISCLENYRQQSRFKDGP